MNISANSRDIIVQEIIYVVNQMEQSSTREEKLFYFSGVSSVIQRIFNLEYNSDLVYAHFILNGTYVSFLQRLQAIKQGETVIPLDEEHFGKLTAITEELAKKIKEKKNIDSTLKKLAILSYATLGNGYYLFQKGLLKI